MGARPGAAFEVVERDDGHIGVGDAARYFTAPEDLSALDRRALGLARGRILDIGCGAGRHTLALERAGADATGLDPSPGAVGVAVDRGLRVQLGSIAEPPPGLGRSDTLLLLGNNLGLLGGVDTAGEVLRALASLARPGARLVGTGMDPATDEPEHRAYHAWNRRRGRLPGQLRIRVRDGALAGPWFDYLLVDPDGLRTLAADTPWRVREVERHGRNHVAVLSLGG
ncbi:class I SAM-dependent methyltransferase [Nocardiopsis sp. LOL_012]|uniref:class I SAM-dependent methyltransferase n=1 Tax=Nocardiopsis sp. LOL_012 TaxID=3345409 RepID=UPI003A8C0BC0